MIKFLDAVGDWIAARMGAPVVQRRVGVLMLLASVPLFAAGFFVDEPFLVYQMSAAALFFNGVGTLVAALPTERVE